MNFERFWEAYKIQREQLRDDAWDYILLDKVMDLQSTDKDVVLGCLLGLVEREEGEWPSALFVIEKCGRTAHFITLNYIGSDLISKAIYSSRAAHIIKVLVTCNWWNSEFLVEQYLRNAPISSDWRFVVKNLPDEMSGLFVESFDRYFNEETELGFDFETYLAYSPRKLTLLLNHFSNNKDINHKLKGIEERNVGR